MEKYAFRRLFGMCSKLINASGLLLPAIALSIGCYQYMFQGCTSLAYAPALPATTLASGCYSHMFEGCTSLTTAPELPAATLVTKCYSHMFYECTSLNYIKCLAINVFDTENYCPDWLTSTAVSGTFVRSVDSRTWTTNYFTPASGSGPGTSVTCGIPTGWTVQTYDPVSEYRSIPLTFEILEDGEIGWKASSNSHCVTIEYKKNDENWVTITSSVDDYPTISVHANDTVSFRGSYGTANNKGYNSFTCSGRFNIYGNISSITNTMNNADSLSYRYSSLFHGAENLVSAEHLLLPCRFLSSRCYEEMFRGCTSLTTAPKVLPGAGAAEYCYFHMFSGCTSLVSAPELPLDHVALGCCDHMFDSCTSLTTAPSLPATTLADVCYANMFNGCTSLTTAPELPATEISNSNYNTYDSMFEGCTSLNRIVCYLAEGDTNGNCNNWLSGVPGQGVFTGSSEMTWEYNSPATSDSGSGSGPGSGDSISYGIPYGWTRENLPF